MLIIAAGIIVVGASVIEAVCSGVNKTLNEKYTRI